MVRSKRNKKTRYRGTTLVEAAIVFPFLLIFTLGIIHYGWLYWKTQEITNAARHGARMAVRPDAVEAEIRAAIDNLLDVPVVRDSGYVVQFTPADISAPETGEPLNCTISVPATNIAIITGDLFLNPLAGVDVVASITMAKEGP